MTLQAKLQANYIPATIYLSNIQGQVKLVQDVGALTKGQHRFDLNTQSLVPGLYIASIVADNGKILAQSRIVIQR